MTEQELIQTIVREVLQKLQSAKTENIAGLCSARPLVLVYAARSPELACRLEQILGTEFSFCFQSESVALGEPIRRILPFLSCQSMAELAVGRAPQGTPDCPAEILPQLLAGKTVEVLDFEYKKFMHSAPAALFHLYERYEATLASFGLKAVTQTGPAEYHCQDSLLTEQKICEFAKNGATRLKLLPACLVTPLARDAAKEKGISLL